ncbi:MAG: efflux RND transporter periplasmic adaptor subunit [Proteobacteria bacterium]|nr:efflux RND transporter periplasmic adaptor subunit [Pseudomonadota bacterium]
MSSRFRVHRLAAIVVLIAAGLWIGTGHFASVGSEEAQAAQPAGADAADGAEAPPADAKPLRTVAVVTPWFTDHAREIRISGVTDADKRSVLAARTDGVIRTLPVRQGDTVKAGAAVMDTEGPELVAAVAMAEAALTQRQQEVDVAEKLFKSGNTAELQLIGQRAALAAAEAQLSQAKARADQLTVRAPFAGVLDSVDVELGEWVQTGTPVATLLSLDPIVVRAEVSELDVGHVKIGDSAALRLVNGTELKGTVRHLWREASVATRTYPVEITLPNPDRKIPVGMTTEVRLYTASVKAVTVPRSIITLSEEGELGLRVIDKDDIARFASVEMIDDTPEGLVLAGIPEGVRIVVSGQDLVSEGEKVKPEDVTAEAKAAMEAGLQQ